MKRHLLYNTSNFQNSCHPDDRRKEGPLNIVVASTLKVPSSKTPQDDSFVRINRKFIFSLLSYFFLILSSISISFAQQQPILSLQPAYPSWYNPGATGYSTGHTLSFGHRSQWNSIEEAPTAQLLAFDTRSENKDVFAFGVNLMRETAHRDKLFAFQARTAFHLEAGGSHFSLGVGIGAINRYRDFVGLIIEDHRDITLLQGGMYNLWQLDASIGAQYHFQEINGKYDIKVGLAANRLPMLFETPSGPFRFDQAAHLNFNLQAGFKVANDIVLEPGIQQLVLLSEYNLKAGGTSIWLRATYQRKFWAALFSRPQANTFGLMLGAVLDEGKYAGTLAIDNHAQLGTTWEIGGYANFAPVAKCLDEIESRDPFWNAENTLAAHLQPLFELSGLNYDDIQLKHQYRSNSLELSFGLPEEDASEMLWKTLPESENMLRVICGEVIRDAMEICKEPHLDEIVNIKLRYYSARSAADLEKDSPIIYDASMGDGLILLADVDGQNKRRAIFEGDHLSNLEFQLAKLYSLKERIAYRLGDMGLAQNKIEIEIISGEKQDFPYEIIFEMR